MKNKNRGKERRWEIKVKGKDELVGNAFYTPTGKVQVIVPNEIDKTFNNISQVRRYINGFGYRAKPYH